MKLKNIKTAIFIMCILMTVAIAARTEATWVARLVMATLGVLPPLALLFWWNEPAQTMSEVIDEARR